MDGDGYTSWHDVPEVVAGWQLSTHARQAIVNRGFDVKDVAAALEAPQRPKQSFEFGPDRWTYEFGHLLVPVNLRRREVITVLLRTRARWNDDDARRANRRAG